MAGYAGTARFGVNPDIHPDKTSTNGVSHVDTPMDGPWTETHFVYNPNQLSREMGTTRGSDPNGDYMRVDRQYDAMCNHDGYIAGDMHLMNLDERKVIERTIYGVKCEHADPYAGYPASENGRAPRQTVTAFD